MTNEFVDEKVGYGRPPKQYQFKKGQSGNPRGRPRGRKSIMAQLDAALSERVCVHEAGQRKWMTKLAAGTKQFANKVASGDPQALKILIALKDRPELASTPAPSGERCQESAVELLLRDSDMLHARLPELEQDSTAPPKPCS
jgi:hypothetical protein